MTQYRRIRKKDDEKRVLSKKRTVRSKETKTYSYDNFSYAKIKYDKDGFADASKYKPDKFDLVNIKINRKGWKKTIAGWWTGSEWYSRRLLEGDKVVAWAKTSNYGHILNDQDKK